MLRGTLRSVHRFHIYDCVEHRIQQTPLKREESSVRSELCPMRALQTLKTLRLQGGLHENGFVEGYGYVNYCIPPALCKLEADSMRLLTTQRLQAAKSNIRPLKIGNNHLPWRRVASMSDFSFSISSVAIE